LRRQWYQYARALIETTRRITKLFEKKIESAFADFVWPQTAVMKSLLMCSLGSCVDQAMNRVCVLCFRYVFSASLD
jgi:hypothetical protein